MAIQNLTNTQHNGWVYLPYYPNGWVYLPSQYSISCIGFLSHFILILRAHALQCYIPLYLTTCPFSCFWSLLLFFFCLFGCLFLINEFLLSYIRTPVSFRPIGQSRKYHYILFFAQTECAVYANSRGADALHVQIMQRTKDIAEVGFTWSTTQMEI